MTIPAWVIVSFAAAGLIWWLCWFFTENDRINNDEGLD